jgi:hypothetical protein
MPALHDQAMSHISERGLSAGASVGVGLGSVAIVAIVMAGLVCFLKRRG